MATSPMARHGPVFDFRRRRLAIGTYAVEPETEESDQSVCPQSEVWSPRTLVHTLELRQANSTSPAWNGWRLRYENTQSAPGWHHILASLLCQFRGEELPYPTVRREFRTNLRISGWRVLTLPLRQGV